jgi:hypothetical protein
MNKKTNQKKTRHDSNHKKQKKNTRKFRKMNCTPMVKGKTLNRDSCFTEPVIQQIKDSYNKHHPNNKIEAIDKNAVWRELKEKMSTCNKEDCWLEEIDDVVVRKKLDKYLFMPDHPSEWKKKPNTWLSNFDIIEVLKLYETSYKKFKVFGPTPIDFDTKPTDLNGQCVWQELCDFNLKKYISSGKTKLGVVFNLDKHDQPGSHWVSLFVDIDDKFIFYMDSAGRSIPSQIDALVKKIKDQGLKLENPIDFKFYENHPTEHQYGDTECGMYSLYFLITMLTDETDGSRFNNFKEKIDFFKNDRIPDNHVERYRKIYYND